VRFDENDDVVWQKAIGGADTETLLSVASVGDGIVAVGSTDSAGAGNQDFWVLALDGAGAVLWQKAIGGINLDRATHVVGASNGDILVVGNTLSFGAGGQDAWVARLDGAGAILWQKSFGGGGTDIPEAVIADGDGFIVAGRTSSFGATNSEAWLLRLDGLGNMTWSSRYGVAGNYNTARAVAHGGQHLLVAGSTEDDVGSNFLIFQVGAIGAAAGALDAPCALFQGVVQPEDVEVADAAATTTDAGFVSAGTLAATSTSTATVDTNPPAEADLCQ
jgi:hypothetical protein